MSCNSRKIMLHQALHPIENVDRLLKEGGKGLMSAKDYDHQK